MIGAVLKLRALRRWSILVAFVLGSLASNLRADETFPSLVVSGNTYSNVTVMNKNRTHVFISHAKGMASFRVEDLSIDLQRELGYVVEPPPEKLSSRLAALQEVDPKYLQMQVQIENQIVNWLKTVDRQVVWGILAGIGVAYLFFCYCCLLICQKAGHKPGIWIWIPIIQVIPMLRAAGMSGWNFILLLLPIIGTIVGIIWSFKICQARKKGAWLGLFLLLPITNLLTFLYLAFADSLQAEEDEVIKLKFS